MNFNLLILIIPVLIMISCTETKNVTDTVRENDQSAAVSKIAELKPLADGKITTSFNGFDMQSVNLWNSTDREHIITSKLTHGEKVKILSEEDSYYLIETLNSDKHRGYCMKEFVVMVTVRE